MSGAQCPGVVAQCSRIFSGSAWAPAATTVAASAAPINARYLIAFIVSSGSIADRARRWETRRPGPRPGAARLRPG